MLIDKLSCEEKPNLQGIFMLQPSDVNRILTLHSLGWGAKRISRELGISRTTIKKYLCLGSWRPPVRRRTRKLEGMEFWLKDSFEKHRGNADVVRQELISEHGIHVSLRTVERAVLPFRQEAMVKARATIRFETPPGKQLQIDFGSTQVSIGGEKVKVYLFVATLGYSRRFFVTPFLHERQNVWFKGIEGAFSHFGGIPEQILLDNAKALVISHNPQEKEVVFNERFQAFAKYWGFNPAACAPYRARTKGKDERMVGYVKRNAIAGRTFLHWESFKAHLEKWTAEIADLRVHGTVEERPLERFLRDEAKALKQLPNKPSFIQIRELFRRVHVDACVEVDTNHYSVPCNLIGESVTVHVVGDMLKIFHRGAEVASHIVCEGRRKRALEPDHLQGIVGASLTNRKEELGKHAFPRFNSDLLRPLAEYEVAVGGGW